MPPESWIHIETEKLLTSNLTLGKAFNGIMSTHEKCVFSHKRFVASQTTKFKISFSLHRTINCILCPRYRENEKYSTYQTKAKKYFIISGEKKQRKKKRIKLISSNVMNTIHHWQKEQTLNSCMNFGISWMIPKYWQIEWKTHTHAASTKSVNNNGGKNHLNSVSSMAKMEWSCHCWDEEWNWKVCVHTNSSKCVCLETLLFVTDTIRNSMWEKQKERERKECAHSTSVTSVWITHSTEWTSKYNVRHDLRSFLAISLSLTANNQSNIYIYIAFVTFVGVVCVFFFLCCCCCKCESLICFKRNLRCSEATVDKVSTYI